MKQLKFLIPKANEHVHETGLTQNYSRLDDMVSKPGTYVYLTSALYPLSRKGVKSKPNQFNTIVTCKII